MAEHEYELTSASVTVQTPDGWSALTSGADGAVTLRSGLSPLVPGAVLTLSEVPGASADDVLQDQVAQAVMALTDYTVLHVDGRPGSSDQWPDQDPPARAVVTAAFRQGVFTMVNEIGVLAGDGQSCLVANMACPLDEWPAQEEAVVAAFDSVRVVWRRRDA